MFLKIYDIKGSTDAGNDEEIELVLSKRYGTGVNEFWVSRVTDEYPAIAIVVNGDLASISYFMSQKTLGLNL